MGSSVVLLVAPTAEPLTVDDLKVHLRIDADETADDDRLAEILQAARETLEADTETAIMPQTWRLTLDDFPASEIVLPRGPVQEIDAFTYVSTGGTTTAVESSVYSLETTERRAALRLKWLQTWPTHRGDERGIVLDFVCGYADADAVPARYKQALLLMAELLYDGEAMVGSVTPGRNAYHALMRQLKRYSYP